MTRQSLAVERNQQLILLSPVLLHRILLLLQIVSYGPKPGLLQGRYLPPSIPTFTMDQLSFSTSNSLKVIEDIGAGTTNEYEYFHELMNAMQLYEESEKKARDNMGNTKQSPPTATTTTTSASSGAISTNITNTNTNTSTSNTNTVPTARRTIPVSSNNNSNNTIQSNRGNRSAPDDNAAKMSVQRFTEYIVQIMTCKSKSRNIIINTTSNNTADVNTSSHSSSSTSRTSQTPSPEQSSIDSTEEESAEDDLLHEEENGLGTLMKIVRVMDRIGVLKSSKQMREMLDIDTNNGIVDDDDEEILLRLYELMESNMTNNSTHTRKKVVSKDVNKVPIINKEQYDSIRKVIIFASMYIWPYQIELCFVLCTLLSGRRKIDVQNKLCSLEFHRILARMWYQLEWNIEHYKHRSSLTMDAAHRIQVLRVFHNYYDRDFIGNISKFTLLSAEEIRILRNYEDKLDVFYHLNSNELEVILPLSKRGVLYSIIQVFAQVHDGSTYRFWLASVIEAFLRGSRAIEQLYAAK